MSEILRSYHVCNPPVPCQEPKGSVWLCDCGSARVKTQYDYIPEAWRRPLPWEFRVRRLQRQGLKAREKRLADERLREAEALVNSYDPTQHLT